MKPPPDLLIGLGNPLMGDEGIGWRVAEGLRDHPGLPPHVEVILGGTDLLRLERCFEGRARVILVDAMLDPARPGDFVVVQDCFQNFDPAQGHVHCLSAVQAIELLRAVNPGLGAVLFTLAGIGIGSASVGTDLSEPLAAALPGIVDRLLEDLFGAAAESA